MPLCPPLLKGTICEVFGAASCGKTTLLHNILAEATEDGECCALVDALNAFDPDSAALAGVDLRRLLWVRGSGHASPVRVDHAFKSVDMLIHGGGFGVVVLDLSDVSARDLQRVPLSYWYRFRLAVENTPTRLVVTADVPLVKSCARLQLEAKRQQVLWRGPLFGGIECSVEARKVRHPVVLPNVGAQVMKLAG